MLVLDIFGDNEEESKEKLAVVSCKVCGKEKIELCDKHKIDKNRLLRKQVININGEIVEV